MRSFSINSSLVFVGKASAEAFIRIVAAGDDGSQSNCLLPRESLIKYY